MEHPHRASAGSPNPKSEGATGEEPVAEIRHLHEETSAGRFPPARSPSVGAPPEETTFDGHNLPLGRTSFVGREREMGEVKRLLDMSRLLTLTGAGGSGKTRLAVEVAKDLLGSYPEGVWMVELAPLWEGDLVPQAVAGVLGVREQPKRPLTDTLAQALKATKMLLVLDNCEHLVDACARLVDVLLGTCPGVKVLATSRETLGVAGEAIWSVPPLSLPEAERPPTVEELEGYESARLFVERALYRDPSFVLSPENARAVAEICRRLDGIPLAIELAAARVGVLSAEQISERLEDSLKLLSTGGRSAVPRHRTLRATLEWSHKLLAEPERKLFCRLSVFAGGWTLEAAEAVGAGEGIDEDDVLDLLSRLVDKSLVVAEAGAEDALRYRMLEPVRQYGLERLEAGGEAERIRERHAAWFLALAEEAEPGLMEVDQASWLERLSLEHVNLRAALCWALEGAQPEERAEWGLRLAAALGRFWNAYSPSEGLRCLERGLARSSSASPPSVRAKALSQAGYIAIFRGDYEKAVAMLEESLALFQELGDKVGIVASLSNLGWAVLQWGDHRRVTALREEAEALRRELTDRRDLAALLHFLGGAAVDEGDPERAVALFEESLALGRELGDTRNISMYSCSLGMSALWQGDHERAAPPLEEALRLLRESGDKWGINYCLMGLAGVAALRSQPARAARLWGASEALREVVGIPFSPFDRATYDYEGYLTAARAVLDERSFAAAWSEGRAMTLEQAIEFALSKEDREPAQPSNPAGLSRREVEVLRLVAQGLSDKQIAARLVLSRHTVHRHVSSILAKLNLPSRAAAATYAVQHGLL